MPEKEPQIGYWELLREYPDYRNLFAAHTLSLCGDWLNTIAIFLLLTEFTGTSARAISGVIILKLLPAFLMGPVAGVVVDRYPRKTVMIVSDLLRAGVVLSVLVVAFYPRAWVLYLATGIQISITSFFEPARSASIPNLVPQRALTTANALGAVTWSAMFTLGSALGGLITEYMGWQAAVLLDGASYLVSALLIGRVVLPHRRRRPKSGHLTFLQMTGIDDVLAGFRYIRSQANVAVLILVKPFWSIATSVTLVLTVLGATEYAIQGSTELGISFLYSARALGTGLGPILARWITGNREQGMWRLMAWSYLWAALWYAGFSMTDRLIPAAAAVTVAHLGGSTIWVFSTVLLQKNVPDEYRGRVFAAEMGLFTLVGSASLWIFGWLMDVRGLNPRAAVLWMSLCMLVSGALWSVAARRSRRQSVG